MGTVRRPGQSRRLWAILLLVLLAVGFYFWWKTPAPPPAVATAAVVRGDIEATVEATGKIKPSKIVGVGAQVSGRIETLAVRLGDTVKKGDLIAEIDSRTQTNSLESAQAALRNAEANRQAQLANLRQFELAYARQQEMLAAEATSPADNEAARANLEATRAQIDALKATIAQVQTTVATAKTNLGYTRITAPIDGTVLAIISKQGQTVNANQSTPSIVLLGDLDTMEVFTEISEADVIRAREGQAVRFTVLGDAERKYHSTLRAIAPAPESVTQELGSTGTSSSSSTSSTSTAIYYNGFFDVPNPDHRLRTYMTAQVSIILDSARGVLLIPSTALGSRGRDGKFEVSVVTADGRQERRQIKTGLDNRSMVEVHEGLTEGERVVIGQAGEGGAAGPAGRRRGMVGPGGGPPPRMM